MKSIVRAICVALLSATPAAAATITFEDVAVSSGSDVLGGDVTSGGFVFDSSGDHLHRINSILASNGTTNLGIHEFPGFDNVVMIRPQAGGVFSLNAIDFGEWLGTNPPTTIQINGVGGSSPTATFVLDGFTDGPGGAPDFQTLTFDATWSNLTAVTLNGIGGPLDVNGRPLGSFALDNVVVTTAVPEPASLLLMGTGLAAAVRSLRRRGGRRPASPRVTGLAERAPQDVSISA
jgi:hypothetical protein